MPRVLPLLLALAFLTACGDETPEPTPHGLKSKGLESAPEGDAVKVTWGVEDGTAYRAVLSITSTAYVKGMDRGRPKDQSVRRHATLEHTWTHQRPPHGAPPTSSIQLQYLDAEGVGAEGLMKREAMTGRLAHDRDGRAVPDSLKLAGGTKGEQLEVADRVGSLLLAGYGGAPSWLPPRPIQVGEAWPLAPLLDLRAVRMLRGRTRELGMSNPNPTFEGTARLKRIIDGPTGRQLEVELDALIELEGTLRDEDGATRAFSSGDRFQGLATIDAVTGVPTTFDVTHTHLEHHTRGSEKMTIGATATVRGTVTRTDTKR